MLHWNMEGEIIVYQWLKTGINWKIQQLQWIGDMDKDGISLSKGYHSTIIMKYDYTREKKLAIVDLSMAFDF